MPGVDGGSSSTAEDVVPLSTSEPQPTELVPDIPLAQYLQSFHYQPPSEPTEVSMRGDASVAEQEASAQRATVPRSAPVDVATPVDASAATAASETKPPVVIADVPPDTAESRLGLEPEAAAKASIERPNFLDLGETPAESKPAMSGTSFITGPSFLGLNDPPPTADARLPKPRKLRKSHWRVWSAALVVLIFAELGWLQWRSHVDHTNNGPVEIVKTKVRDWRQRIPSLDGNEPAPASSVDTNSKPEMQVQPQNQNGNPYGTASSPAGAAAAGATAGATPSSRPPLTSASDQPAPPAQTQTASVNPAANDNLNSTAPADTTPVPAQKPKPPRQTDASNQEAATKPSLAGAEEMAKAKNASDAAATAAWLWKATAKGNPDAPVQLADMYIGGQGVPRSCEQAEVLLKTAAEKENARARNRLASMYATGTCVTRDRVQAYRWLSSALSANPNSDWAKQNRDLIWQQMTPDERAQAEKYR